MRNKKENLSFFFKGISGRYSGLYVVVQFSLHAGRWPDVDMVDLMWPGLFVLLSWRGTLLSWGWEAQWICWWRRWWFCWTSQTVSSLSLPADTDTGFVLDRSDPTIRLLRATMQTHHPGLQRYNFRWGNILLSCRVKGFMFKMSSVSHT